MNRDLASLDHRLKFRRAFHHLERFRAAETDWLDGDSHTVRFEHDPKTRDMTFFATITQEPQMDPFSLCIGDCLHNLRSCLDALAFELASTYPKPLSDELAEHSEFPIFRDMDRRGQTGVGWKLFRDNGLTKIQGWDPRAQAIVERLQPFQRGQGYASDPLWIVHELDRLNKHRLLHPVAGGSRGIGLIPSRSNAVIGPGKIESVGGLVQTDTVVARFPNVRPADPRYEVHVEVTPVLCVAFASGTPCVGGEPVYSSLCDLYFYIGGTVLPQLEPFL